MALTELTKIDKIEITEDSVVQVRQAAIIQRDGQQIAKSYHRWSLQKGDDISEQDSKVQAVCNAVWGVE